MMILASKSPRRQEILSRLLPSFTVIPSSANEDCSDPDPRNYVRELAIRKAGLENTMQTAVNRARSVWDEYKVTYEWFRKGLGGQV